MSHILKLNFEYIFRNFLLCMKHLQNIEGFLISESDIDSMITGFEELGINNPKKLKVNLNYLR